MRVHILATPAVGFVGDTRQRRAHNAGRNLRHRGHRRTMGYAISPWLDHALWDLGTNPTGWSRRWCAKSVNLWLQQSGKRGCGGNTAISCLKAGRRLSGPQVGALALMAHHVGMVKAVNGNSLTLVSGNHNRKVGIGSYSRGRVVAYVWPD